MFTPKNLEDAGAMVVAGLVFVRGEQVSGQWDSKGFKPAEGSPLDKFDTKKGVWTDEPKGE